MTFLAVDPGKRSIAWALFGPELIKVGFVRHSEDHYEHGLRLMLQKVAHTFDHLPDKVLVELPRVYPKARNIRPNDLIDLAAVAGACVCLGSDLEFVHPQMWKGQVPKDISADRSMKFLTRAEKSVVMDYWHNDHVWDAIGIGLWHRNRIA